MPRKKIGQRSLFAATKGYPRDGKSNARDKLKMARALRKGAAIDNDYPLYELAPAGRPG
jgi:hypothetical protein